MYHTLQALDHSNNNNRTKIIDKCDMGDGGGPPMEAACGKRDWLFLATKIARSGSVVDYQNTPFKYPLVKLDTAGSLQRGFTNVWHFSGVAEHNHESLEEGVPVSQPNIDLRQR